MKTVNLLFSPYCMSRAKISLNEVIPSGTNRPSFARISVANSLHNTVSFFLPTKKYRYASSPTARSTSVVLPIRLRPLTTVIIEWLEYDLSRISRNKESCSFLSKNFILLLFYGRKIYRRCKDRKLF